MHKKRKNTIVLPPISNDVWMEILKCLDNMRDINNFGLTSKNFFNVVNNRSEYLHPHLKFLLTHKNFFYGFKRCEFIYHVAEFLQTYYWAAFHKYFPEGLFVKKLFECIYNYNKDLFEKLHDRNAFKEAFGQLSRKRENGEYSKSILDTQKLIDNIFKWLKLPHRNNVILSPTTATFIQTIIFMDVNKESMKLKGHDKQRKFVQAHAEIKRMFMQLINYGSVKILDSSSSKVVKILQKINLEHTLLPNGGSYTKKSIVSCISVPVSNGEGGKLTYLLGCLKNSPFLMDRDVVIHEEQYNIDVKNINSFCNLLKLARNGLLYLNIKISISSIYIFEHLLKTLVQCKHLKYLFLSISFWLKDKDTCDCACKTIYEGLNKLKLRKLGVLNDNFNRDSFMSFLNFGIKGGYKFSAAEVALPYFGTSFDKEQLCNLISLVDKNVRKIHIKWGCGGHQPFPGKNVDNREAIREGVKNNFGDKSVLVYGVQPENLHKMGFPDDKLWKEFITCGITGRYSWELSYQLP